MERKLTEDGFYSELTYSKYDGKPSEINNDILQKFKKNYTKLILPQSNILLENNAWHIEGNGFDDNDQNPMGSKKKFKFTRHAFNSIMRELKIAPNEVSERPYDLVRQTYDLMKQEKPIIVLERDGDIITNIFKLNSRFMPMSVILDKIKNLGFNQILISDASFRLMYLTDRSFNVKVGDKHQVGWILDGSNFKNGSKISAKIGTFRLVCLNGATALADGTSFTYSRDKLGGYEYGIEKFFENVKSFDFDKHLEEITNLHVNAAKTYPLNSDLVDVFRTCKKFSSETFGDAVVGWDSSIRKDYIKIASTSDKSIRNEFLEKVNTNYGYSYDIINRMTDMGKQLSVLTQVQLQDYVGCLLRKQNKN